MEILKYLSSMNSKAKLSQVENAVQAGTSIKAKIAEQRIQLLSHHKIVFQVEIKNHQLTDGAYWPENRVVIYRRTIPAAMLELMLAFLEKTRRKGSGLIKCMAAIKKLSLLVFHS